MFETGGDVNPYVGLRPFEREDSLRFFGRREQTRELLERLHDTRFLAVVGSSGCGKSSLIRAGLIPALVGGFLVEERDTWRVAVMKPGDAPLRNLAAALCATAGGRPADEEVEALRDAVAEGHTRVVLDRLAPELGDDANLLLLIDQFEEIFAFRGTEDDEELERLSAERRRRRARRRAEAADFVALVLELAEHAELPVYTVLTMRTDFLGDCDRFYGLPEALNRGRYLVPRLTRQQLRQAVEGPALLYGARIAPRLLDRVLNKLGDRSDRLPVLQHALLRTWDLWQAAGGEGPLDVEHYRAAGTLDDALSRHAEEALRDDDLALTARIFKALTDTDAGRRRVRRPASLFELMAVSGAERRAVEAVLERFREDGRHFIVLSEGAVAGDPPILAVAFEPDGEQATQHLVEADRRVVTVAADGAAKVWRIGKRPDPVVLESYFAQPLTAAFSPDGARVVISTEYWRGETVQVFTLDDPAEPKLLGGSYAPRIPVVALGPRDDRIVAVDEDGNVWRIFADDPREPRELLEGPMRVRSVELSPDGERLLLVGDDDTAQIWPSDGKGEVAVLAGPKVGEASFSPDGTRVVTTGDNDTRALVRRLDGHDEPLELKHETAVRMAVFSPEGRVVTLDDKGTVRRFAADGTADPEKLYRARRQPGRRSAVGRGASKTLRPPVRPTRRTAARVSPARRSSAPTAPGWRRSSPTAPSSCGPRAARRSRDSSAAEHRSATSPSDRAAGGWRRPRPTAWCGSGTPPGARRSSAWRATRTKCSSPPSTATAPWW